MNLPSCQGSFNKRSFTVPVNLLQWFIIVSCVLFILGNVANRKDIDKQSSRSLMASINEGYLKYKRYNQFSFSPDFNYKMWCFFPK